MPNETDNEEGARGNVSRRNFFERIGVAGAVAAMPTGPVPAAAQAPAMATEVSADDRFRIQDVLRSYVWVNDSGSVERVVAAFTPDGIVQPAVFPCGVGRARPSLSQGGAAVSTGYSTSFSSAPRTGLRCAPIGRWCRGLPQGTPGR